MTRGRARGLTAAALAAAALAAAALAAVVLAAVVLAGAAPATGAAPGQGAPEVALAGQTTWVHRGERFDVEVQVAGAPADAALRLVVHGAPSTRQDFRRTLEGELGDVIANGGRRPLAELPATAPGVYTTGFAVGDDLDLPGRGAYPVEVQLLAADGRELDTFVTYLSYLSRPTPEFRPLDVAVVLDVGAGPPILQPDGSRAAGDDTLARIRERVEVLDETPDRPLTVAPVPETLDGLAAPDDPAGAALLERLGADAQRRGVLARPYVDVDLTALDQADLSGEAVQQRDTGVAVVRDRLGVEPSGGIWLAGGTLGAEAARAAVDLGYDRVLVPPSAVEPAGRGERASRSGGRGDADDGAGDVPETPVRLGDRGPLGMVDDPALAEQLTGGDGVLGAHRLIGELTAMWLEAPALPRAVAVRIPADAEIDPAAVAVAVDGLGDGQAVQAVGLDKLFADVPPAEGDAGVVALAAHQVSHDLTPISAGLQAARSGIDGVAGVTGDPTIAADLRRSLLVSTGTATPDDARAAYVDHVNEALGAVAGSVTLPDQFRITLTSRSSSIPVQLTNNTDRDVNVMVQVDSDQLEFPEGDFIAATLAPGTTRIEVPVRVRTSGAFTMVVRVTSPDGSLLLDTSTFDIRSTAISGVGLLLSIGAGLFLAVWWLRHWRRARRSRHLMPAGGEPDTGPDGDGARAPEDVDVAYRPAHMAGDHAVQGSSGVVR
jgi:hypothetical protein